MELHRVFLVAIVCIGLGLPAINQARRTALAVQKKKVVIDDRWYLTFKLYDGKDCRRSKLKVSWRDLMKGKRVEWIEGKLQCGS
jgi:hypothetical protein